MSPIQTEPVGNGVKKLQNKRLKTWRRRSRTRSSTSGYNQTRQPRRDPREPLHVRTHTTTPQNTTLYGFSAFKEKNKLHPLVRARPLIKLLLKASKMHDKYPRTQYSAARAQGGEPRLCFWKNRCFLPAPLLSSPIVWPPSSPTESSCTR